MGYYTTHELEIIEGDNFITDWKHEVSEEVGYDPFGEECKWYSHEHDMRIVSERHPETLFKLSGDGEENGDLWHEYYKNGKMQKCKAIISFEDYEESKLS